MIHSEAVIIKKELLLILLLFVLFLFLKLKLYNYITNFFHDKANKIIPITLYGVNK